MIYVIANKLQDVVTFAWRNKIPRSSLIYARSVHVLPGIRRGTKYIHLTEMNNTEAERDIKSLFDIRGCVLISVGEAIELLSEENATNE
jgi:hypothetical protein